MSLDISNEQELKINEILDRGIKEIEKAEELEQKINNIAKRKKYFAKKETENSFIYDNANKQREKLRQKQDDPSKPETTSTDVSGQLNNFKANSNSPNSHFNEFNEKNNFRNHNNNNEFKSKNESRDDYLDNNKQIDKFELINNRNNKLRSFLKQIKMENKRNKSPYEQNANGNIEDNKANQIDLPKLANFKKEINTLQRNIESIEKKLMENGNYAIISPLSSWENPHEGNKINLNHFQRKTITNNNHTKINNKIEFNLVDSQNYLKINSNYNPNSPNNNSLLYNSNTRSFYQDNYNQKANLASNSSQDLFFKSNSNNNNNTILNQTKNLFEKSSLHKTDSLEVYCNKYQNYMRENDFNFNKDSKEFSATSLKNLSKKENTIDVIFQNRVTDPFIEGEKEEEKFPAAYSSRIKNENLKEENELEASAKSKKYSFYYNTLDNFSELNKFNSNFNNTLNFARRNKIQKDLFDSQLESKEKLGFSTINDNPDYNIGSSQNGKFKIKNNFDYPLYSETISIDPSLADYPKTITNSKHISNYNNYLEYTKSLKDFSSNQETLKNETNYNNNNYNYISNRNNLINTNTLTYSESSSKQEKNEFQSNNNNNNNNNHNLYQSNNYNKNKNSSNTNYNPNENSYNIYQKPNKNYHYNYNYSSGGNQSPNYLELQKEIALREEQIRLLKLQIASLNLEKEEYYSSLQSEKAKNKYCLKEIERLNQIKNDLKVLTEKYEFLTKEYRYLVLKYEKAEQSLQQQQNANLNLSLNNNNKQLHSRKSSRYNTNSHLNNNNNNISSKQDDKSNLFVFNTDEDLENIKNQMEGENPFLKNQRPTRETKNKRKKLKSKIKKNQNANENNNNQNNKVNNITKITDANIFSVSNVKNKKEQKKTLIEVKDKKIKASTSAEKAKAYNIKVVSLGKNNAAKSKINDTINVSKLTNNYIDNNNNKSILSKPTKDSRSKAKVKKN